MDITPLLCKMVIRYVCYLITIHNTVDCAHIFFLGLLFFPECIDLSSGE